MKSAQLIPSWLCAALLLLFHAAPPVWSAALPNPPERMTYQGFLVDANGSPIVTGTPENFPAVFRIYDVSSGGSALWAEQQVVTVDNGSFSVMLGEGNPVEGSTLSLSAVFAGESASERYIGVSVTIGAETMEILPRLRLVPAPYAFLANNAVNLIQPDGSAVITYAGEKVQVTGTVSATGVEVGSGGIKIAGNNTLEFGAGLTKQVDAGKIGYGSFSGTMLDIVGAGTLPSNRRVRFWAEGGVFTDGPMGIGTLTLGGAAGAQVAIRRGAADQAGSTIGYGLSVNRLNTDTGALFLGADTGLNGVLAFNAAQLRIGRQSGSSFTENIRVDASGNVGIGTASPDRRLTLQPATGSTEWLSLKDNGGTTRWHLNHLSGGLNFAQSGVTDGRLFLASGGNVGIGTTAPSHVLTIQSPNETTVRLIGPNSFGHGARLNFGDANIVYLHEYVDDRLRIQAHTIGIGRDAPSNRLEVEGSASKTTAGDWLANSDARIKQDVRSLEGALEVISRIRPVAFRYTDDYRKAHPSIEDIDYYNVIAQEFARVFPDAVKPSGDRLPNGEEILQVDTHPASMHAIAAIRELHALSLAADSRVAALEEKASRVDALEREVAELKKQLAAQVRAQDEVEARFSALESLISTRVAAASGLRLDGTDR